MARHRLFRPADWAGRTILFYVLFQGIHFALFGYGWYKQQADSRLAALNKLRYSVWLSRGAALALSLDACLLVIPMCRECMKFLRPKMRWIPLHDSQWFHRQVAYSLLFYTAVHSGSHYVNFFNVAHLKLRPVSAIQIHYTQAGGITGHVMLLCMLLMYTTAHVRIRRQSYEGFWHIHQLFIVFFLALLCHGTGCFVRDTATPYSPFAGKVFWEHCIGYQSFRWELLPLVIYAGERAYRFYRSRKDIKVIAILRPAPTLLEIRFEKEGIDYKAGQWLLVKFPDIIANQWHPFSITSCPGDPYVSIHIQQAGDFTGTFADAFDTKTDHYQLTTVQSTGVQELRLKKGQMFPRMRIDGPHGSLAEDVLKHEVSVMVGSGIGVTPWVSILRSIWRLRNDIEVNQKSKLKRVEFIWICKDILHYKWLHEQITALEDQSALLGSERRWPIVRFRIFVTRRVDALKLEQVHFDVSAERYSNPSSPISPVESWKEKPWPVAGSIEDRSTWDTNRSPTISIPASQFQAEMHNGRPSFTHELEALTQELIEDGYGTRQGGQTKKIKAGVYYCGPDEPWKALRDACLKVSGKEVEYNFWRERGG